MKMKIYDWMLENKLKLKDICMMLDCHRQTIRKVQQNMAINEKIAMKIRILTLNKVVPSCRNQGRKKTCKQIHNVKKTIVIKI